MVVPAENLVGVEGRGFRYILDGMNAERLLIASECIGDAKLFTAKSMAYASTRQVFGRAIGQNQGGAVPDRTGLCPDARCRVAGARGAAAFRCWVAVWTGGEYGQDAGGRRELGGG